MFLMILWEKKEQHFNLDNLSDDDLKKLKIELINNISQDLRTPLNFILGFTQMMLEGIYGDLNHEQRETLNIIYKNSKSLHELIEDLLKI